MEKIALIAAVLIAIAIGFALPGPSHHNHQTASQIATLNPR